MLSFDIGFNIKINCLGLPHYCQKAFLIYGDICLTVFIIYLYLGLPQHPHSMKGGGGVFFITKYKL